MASLVLPVPVAIASSMERRSAAKRLLDRLDRALLVVAKRKAELERHFLERRGRGILIDLKLARRDLPASASHQGAAVVRRSARVAEPDAALGLDLLQIGAAVGGEDEGHLVLAPRSAREREIAACADAAGITLGLIDGGRDVLASPLCLDNADQRQADEQGIVGRAACGRPFGNGEIASLCRSCAVA